MFYRYCSAVLVAWFYSLSAQAEGLMTAYQQALAGDPQLRRAASDRLADQEAKPQARALLLPSLGAEAGVDQNFAVDPGEEASFSGNSVAIALSQPLYNRANWIRNRQAETIVKQADSDFLTVAQALLLRVSERYFAVLSAQEDLLFIRADKEAIARQLEQAKQRFEVGLITITDVQEAQARFDLAVADEIRAINALADAKEALREVTGEFYEQLEQLSDRMPLELPDPSDPDAWVALAEQHNPVLASAALAVEIARETVELQRSGHYPTVDLNASYRDTDSSVEGRESRGGVIGLELNIPLYQGGAVVSRTRQAAYQLEAAKEFFEQQRRSVIRQVRNAYRGVQNSISAVKALAQARISNRSALEATEAGFEVGTRTIVDVLDAQRDLFRADRDYAQARYTYILNDLRLKQAAGKISEADLERIESWLD